MGGELTFFSLETLKNPAVILMAVVLGVQFLKEPLDMVTEALFDRYLPTKLLALMIAWFIMLSVEYLQGTLNLESAFLIMINGIVVAVAAMKTAEEGIERGLIK